ncbi:MAG TPA: four-carbon acid sugar kinase family protein, partial [Flavisolibacter sp.]
MIVVIADDITGAAELAGIGLRYGLKVLVSAEVGASTQHDLHVIFTNTRSMPEADAVRTMRYLTEQVKGLAPSL